MKMNLESVEEKDILQVNATMISGAFIFLSLVISAGEKALLIQVAKVAYLKGYRFTSH
jgi:hypothetical protein